MRRWRLPIRATALVMTTFVAMFPLVSRAETTTPPPAADTEADLNYVHTFTGFTFPTKVEGFTRVKVTPFNPDKSDIEVDYNNSPFTVHLSFYVYPAGDPLKKHYEECRAAVTKAHPEAKLLEENPAALVKNGKTYEGFNALLSFKDTFVGQTEQDLLSRVILFQYGRYYVLFRISYAASDKAKAERQITDFIEKFTWPTEPVKSPSHLSD